jgi:hypothetical protein
MLTFDGVYFQIDEHLNFMNNVKLISHLEAKFNLYTVYNLKADYIGLSINFGD